MITISREAGKVKLVIEGGPLNHSYMFYWNCNDECYAELLSRHFDRRLDEMVQAIRKSEYDQGYKDGRAKRAKRSWFSPLLKLINY